MRKCSRFPGAIYAWYLRRVPLRVLAREVVKRADDIAALLQGMQEQGGV
jgi:hypothetical protein